MIKSLFETQSIKHLPSKWDLLSLSVVLSVMFIIAWTSSNLGGDINYTEIASVKSHEVISMSLWDLPSYTADTVVRMFIALFLSFIFSFSLGAWAAKSTRAEKIIIPMIDVLQSIPILGFLSITITGFLVIFPTTLWGAQAAVIFGVFTAQAWNMMLSFYQSLKIIPKELSEACDMYNLSAWQKFWKLEVPFAMPGMIWNTMMSMSASWFMIVASETIVVNFSAGDSADINLPGIGTFINFANESQDFMAVGAAVLMMLIVIIIYDQLLFKPLVSWCSKFSVSEVEEEKSKSWFFNILLKSPYLIAFHSWSMQKLSHVVNYSKFRVNLEKSYKIDDVNYKENKISERNKNLIWTVITYISVICFLYLAWLYIYNTKDNPVTVIETLKVFGYGLITGGRVFVLIIITSIIWVPIGIWVGLNPKWSRRIQPYIQIFAAFPVNLLYGVCGVLILTFDLDFNIWCIVLMALGTQWYILFNVIAGASTIPYELKLAAKNMQLKGIKKWTKFYLPAVMPYYVTGAITAAGGAWNASIVCEYINWGKGSVIQATGIGSYISEQYNAAGDHIAQVALAVVIMSILVVISNKLIWRKLYIYSENKYSMNM